jgi:hypothetical protein
VYTVQHHRPRALNVHLAPQVKAQRQSAYQQIDAAEVEQKALGAQIREAVIAASRRASRFSASGEGEGAIEVVDGVDLNELELQLAKILGGDGGKQNQSAT